MPIDRHAERLLRMLAISAQAHGGDGDAVAHRRRGLEQLAELGDDRCDERGDEQATSQEIRLPMDLPARLYAPLQSGTALRPTLIYFHGGGWVAGSLNTHDGLCRRLACASGCRILSVGYRLAPEHPFPAALEDGLAAFRWAEACGEEHGIDRTRLAVGGDSAGAAIAAALAQIGPAAALPPIRLQVLICPILDLITQTASREEFGDGYFLNRREFAADIAAFCSGIVDKGDPRLSPARGHGLGSLPPAIIHAAEIDPFRDEALAYGRAIVSAGGRADMRVHPGMIHYFYALARAIPWARVAATEIGVAVGDFFA